MALQQILQPIMASHFLKGVASCQLTDELIDVDFMDGVFKVWDALPNDKEIITCICQHKLCCWYSLQKAKKKNTVMSVLEFAKKAKLSKIADDAASKLSIANQKIAKNIHARLSTLYKLLICIILFLSLSLSFDFI
jgi:hypothetical protein